MRFKILYIKYSSKIALWAFPGKILCQSNIAFILTKKKKAWESNPLSRACILHIAEKIIAKRAWLNQSHNDGKIISPLKLERHSSEKGLTLGAFHLQPYPPEMIVTWINQLSLVPTTTVQSYMSKANRSKQQGITFFLAVISSTSNYKKHQ